MTGNAWILLIACCLALAWALRANRRLVATGPQLRPYRYGYWLAGVAGLVTLANVVWVVGALGDRRLDVGALITAMVLAGIAIGVYRRRRYGWLLVTGAIALVGMLISVLLVAGEAAAVLVLAVTAIWLAALGLHLRYAIARWPDLAGPSGAASPTAAGGGAAYSGE